LFGQNVRLNAARLAISIEGKGALTWAELELATCTRVLQLADLPRNQPVSWWSPDPASALPIALALLHLAIPWSLDPKSPPLPEAPLKAVPPAQLSRLQADLRERDIAVVTSEKMLTQGELFQWASSLKLDNTLLATTEPLWAALACMVSGTPLLVGSIKLLPRASIWLGSPEDLIRLPIVPSRLGSMGRLVKSISPSRIILGESLSKVLVAGPPPADKAQALLDRGIPVIQIAFPGGMG
jgi:hypothetical protein